MLTTAKRGQRTLAHGTKADTLQILRYVGWLEMNSAEPPPQLNDLMAAIGYLLLRWGALEGQLAGAAPPAELDRVRSIRNLLCHGLEEASSDPQRASDPLVRCRDTKGQQVTVTYSDLQDAIRTLERFGGALGG